MNTPISALSRKKHSRVKNNWSAIAAAPNPVTSATASRSSHIAAGAAARKKGRAVSRKPAAMPPPNPNVCR